MKTQVKSLLLLCLFAVATLNVQAQFPKPKIKKPKINVPTKSSSSSSSSGSSIIKKDDPSGLFENVTEDPSAEMHRKNAVATLGTMETNFSSSSIDYEEFKKMVAKNEKTLGFIDKLEPESTKDKYYAKWNPLKERADKEIAAYNRAVELEKLIQSEFGSPSTYKNHDPLSFRTQTYGANKACYCRTYDSRTKTHAEFESAKNEYEEQTAKLVGYSNENTQKSIAKMMECIEKGNDYAVWASTQNVDASVQGFYDKENAVSPKKVITRCDDYLAALDRIETDYSLNLSANAKSSIAAGRTKINQIKAQSEEYISSGKYQAHLDKLHAEKIAKVFLPKPVSRNSAMEAGAMKHVKSSKYGEYVGEKVGVTTYKASMQTNSHRVVKNDIDIPKYQYHEIWVSYKGKDGKCYRVAVYANYTYKGGGTYDTVANWASDRPEEMDCANVSK